MSDALEERLRRLQAELDAPPAPRGTWFLSPERASPDAVAAQAARAAASPVVDAILRTACGAAAVLNEQRQVLAVNAGFLALLGADSPEAVLGLRPGEAVHCVHAAEQLPGGCGTSQACRTCGAAISILATMERGDPVERDLALAVERGGARVDAQFRVRAQRLDLGADRFVLLTLTDVSEERRRAALERALFHDLSDMLLGVVSACDAMDGAPPEEVTIAAADARDVAAHVVQELKLQRALGEALPTGFVPSIAAVPVGGILDALRVLFRRHPAAARRRLRISGDGEEELVETDPYLVQRLVAHMLLNAFEASPEGTEVRLEALARPSEIVLRVWNPGAIPSAVAPRIFQRYFTTKAGAGRGQGTFVMKHFGEQVLRGRVGFTSSEEAGTTFELAIPRSLRPARFTVVTGGAGR